VIPGVDPSVDDTTGGAAHPDPKYMIENFTLTDGAGHTFGPHGNCTRAAYRDTSSRLARVLGALADHSRLTPIGGEPARLGETFIVLTGDHGMENQNPAGKASRTASSSASCATPTSSSSGRTGTSIS
jgi:predicted AlkP superfamily pyrophosphatase or phosphodiesterase